MRGSFYLIKIKSGFRFIINKEAFFRFFFVFSYNLYRYNLIIFTFNFVNSRRASFKFFFTFFSYNLYKYNLIMSALNKKTIINNI